MDRPRILIADHDCPVAEKALKELIEPDYPVIKIVTDSKTLVSDAVEVKPDVVLMDMDMSLSTGLDTGQELREGFTEDKAHSSCDE